MTTETRAFSALVLRKPRVRHRAHEGFRPAQPESLAEFRKLKTVLAKRRVTIDSRGSSIDQLVPQLLATTPILAEKIEAALGNALPASDSLREALRFLFLVGDNDERTLTPSHRVDLAWHEFILCTQLYSRFCHQHFGRFIHHHPGGSPDENAHQYRETIRLYKQVYGTPDPRFWGQPGQSEFQCGACENR